MLPTFNNGDVVLFVRAKHYIVGDVVLAVAGDREIIKRIAGQEGPNVYLMGDNTAASTDSRAFGAVPVASIKGKLGLRLPLAGLF